MSLSFLTTETVNLFLNSMISAKLDKVEGHSTNDENSYKGV